MKFFPQPALVFFFSLIALFSQAQKHVPRMAKYQMGSSKVEIYFPAKPDAPTIAFAQDSSKVTTMECTDSSQSNVFHFGAILVEVKNDMEKDGEEILMNYMDYLKSALGITAAAGYGKGHIHEMYAEAKGVIDYWESEDGTQWKVNGWVYKSYLVVQFIYGPEDYPIYNIADMFKNGVRFP